MSSYNLSPVRFGGVSFTTTSLGVNDPQPGDRCSENGVDYLFVYNEGGASAPVGCGVVLNSAATGYSVTVSAATSADYLIGVTQNSTMATGAYAWVVTRGICTVKMMTASGTVAARQLLELGANGYFYGASNTTANGLGWGQAVSAIVSSASGQAYISCF